MLSLAENKLVKYYSIYNVYIFNKTEVEVSVH